MLSFTLGYCLRKAITALVTMEAKEKRHTDVQLSRPKALQIGHVLHAFGHGVYGFARHWCKFTSRLCEMNLMTVTLEEG